MTRSVPRSSVLAWARPIAGAALALVLVATAACGKGPVEAMTQGEGTIGNLADADVSEGVRAALRQHSDLRRFDIAVVTVHGDVQLSGTLDEQSQIDQAIMTARTVEGARTIHDGLKLRR